MRKKNTIREIGKRVVTFDDNGGNIAGEALLTVEQVAEL